jgi:2-polyprenyl-6-methoxyphenol hydroxylase-like FAD-dependent oxidoreductase
MFEQRKHAVVVGGSITGMLVAKMLSDYFERVTVLDRDAEPAAAAHRASVAQSKHIHVLLSGGQQVLEALFPGIERDLADAGSVAFRVGYDVINFDEFGQWPRRDLGFKNHTQSRPLLEHVVRRRLSGVDNVEIRWGCRVDGLLPNPSNQHVSGVRYHAGDAQRELAADLIVDSAGPQSRTLEWLRELGYPVPEETRIEVDFGYASTLFAIPEPARLPSLGLAINPPMPRKRAGLMQQIEGKRWIVSLAGRLGDYPPTDLTGFRDYAKSLPSPLLYDAIADLEPLQPIAGFRYPTSIRRRFEKLADFPEGLLPVGDAVCSFNPVYGQGMSSAAKQVEALGVLIDEAARVGGSLIGLWRAYFPIASEIVATPWTQAGSADFAYPETLGVRPPNFEFSQRFNRALAQLAIEDSAVHKLVFEVMQLAAPQTAFRDPALVERVMRIVERNAANGGGRG